MILLLVPPFLIVLVIFGVCVRTLQARQYDRTYLISVLRFIAKLWLLLIAYVLGALWLVGAL